VKVEVADRRTGGGTHVVSDIVSVRRTGVVEDPQKPALQGGKPFLLFGGKFADVLKMSTRIDKQVTGIIRIQIYRSDKKLVAPNAEIYYLRTPITREAEYASCGMLSSDVRHFLEAEEVSTIPHKYFLPAENVGCSRGEIWRIEPRGNFYTIPGSFRVVRSSTAHESI
jgi:hypothetical protein